jgi:hypothetical protein
VGEVDRDDLADGGRRDRAVLDAPALEVGEVLGVGAQGRRRELTQAQLIGVADQIGELLEELVPDSQADRGDA